MATRNPVKSPVEVGIGYPIIYLQCFIYFEVVQDFLHQQYLYLSWNWFNIASLSLKNDWMEDKTQGLPFGGSKCASELLAFGMSFLEGVGLFARKIWRKGRSDMSIKMGGCIRSHFGSSSGWNSIKFFRMGSNLASTITLRFKRHRKFAMLGRKSFSVAGSSFRRCVVRPSAAEVTKDMIPESILFDSLDDVGEIFMFPKQNDDINFKVSKHSEKLRKSLGIEESDEDKWFSVDFKGIGAKRAFIEAEVARSNQPDTFFESDAAKHDLTAMACLIKATHAFKKGTKIVTGQNSQVRCPWCGCFQESCSWIL